METTGKVKKKSRKLPTASQDEGQPSSAHSEDHAMRDQTRARFDELLKSAIDQNTSGTGKTPKKKAKKMRAQTADAMLESLKKGSLHKTTELEEDPTTLANTFNAEDSPRFSKNTTNARRKKLPPKKGRANKGFIDDEGLEMNEYENGDQDAEDGLKKVKKKVVKKKLTEEAVIADTAMTMSELEHIPKKPKRRKKKMTETADEIDGEETVTKETKDDQTDNEPEEQSESPKSKGKKKKKKKKTGEGVPSTSIPTDDGQVFGMTIHRSDRLKADLYIAHPLVRVHIVDLNTGTYLKKSEKERAVTSYYETKNENLDYILPVLTQPFDFKKRKSMVPNWEDQLVFNESYQYLIHNKEGCPMIIIFFEILDFVSMNIASTRPRLLKGEGTWHRIAWAFLKLVGANGSPNTDKKVRLQLFYPPFAYKAKPSQLDVFQWWQNVPRQAYPATLYVTAKAVKPPDNVEPSTRSRFATQEERGIMTYQELKDTITMRTKDQNLNRTQAPAIWSKLPGQTCRVPNKESLSLAGDKKGCHVIKFSPNGCYIACGCKDKEGYPIVVYEIPSGRLKGQFPGHYSLIYDICWSASGAEILTASSDATARIWQIDMPDSAADKVFPHPSFVYTSRYHPHYEALIITGGYDHYIRVWSKDSNSQSGELLYEYEGHKGFVNCISFSPDGLKMYSGDSQGVVIMWKSTGSEGNWMISRQVKDKEMEGVPINSVRVHPSGRRLLAHGRDNNLRMLDLRIFCMMQQYIGVLNFREQVRSTLSPCGSFVFSGSEDRNAYVWNTDTGDQIAVYTGLGYRHPVCDVDYHPHEHMVALCSRGEGHPIKIYIYDSKVAQLSLGFARAKLGADADAGTVTDEEERLVSTLKAKQTLDEDLEEKKRERLARVKRKLSSVVTIQRTPQDTLKIAALQSTFTPGSSNMYNATWGSTFDYTNGWQTQNRGTFGMPGRGPGWTSTPFKKGPMPTINLQAESDGKAVFTFKPPAVEDKKKLSEYNTVVALYNYTAQRSDELNLVEGDEITVLHRDNDNWWMGQLPNGQQGYFPANYVSYEGEELQEMTTPSYQQSGVDETDMGTPRRKGDEPDTRTPRRKTKKQTSGGVSAKKRSKDKFSAVVTKSGELKFLSGAEDSELDPVSTNTTPRRRKKKAVSSSAQKLENSELMTDADSPRTRPPKGNSRSCTTPNLSHTRLDGETTPIKKKKNLEDSANFEDVTENGQTPRSARGRKGSRENLLEDVGSAKKRGGGKRKTKTKHLDDDLNFQSDIVD